MIPNKGLQLCNPNQHLVFLNQLSKLRVQCSFALLAFDNCGNSFLDISVSLLPCLIELLLMKQPRDVAVRLASYQFNCFLNEVVIVVALFFHNNFGFKLFEINDWLGVYTWRPSRRFDSCLDLNDLLD